MGQVQTLDPRPVGNLDLLDTSDWANETYHHSRQEMIMVAQRNITEMVRSCQELEEYMSSKIKQQEMERGDSLKINVTLCTRRAS